MHPSSSSIFSWIRIKKISCSCFAEGGLTVSKGWSGKAMASCSYTKGWNLAHSTGPAQKKKHWRSHRSSTSISCRDWKLLRAIRSRKSDRVRSYKSLCKTEKIKKYLLVIISPEKELSTFHNSAAFIYLGVLSGPLQGLWSSTDGLPYTRNLSGQAFSVADKKWRKDMDTVDTRNASVPEDALQYMDAYDYRMNLGKLKKEVNNIILIYGLCDMVNRAMTLVKYFTPNFGTEYYDVLYGCFCRHRKMTDMEIMLELGMSRASFYRKKKAALRYLGYYFFEIVVPQSANKRYKPSFPETEE